MCLTTKIHCPSDIRLEGVWAEVSLGNLCQRKAKGIELREQSHEAQRGLCLGRLDLLLLGCHLLILPLVHWASAILVHLQFLKLTDTFLPSDFCAFCFFCFPLDPPSLCPNFIQLAASVSPHHKGFFQLLIVVTSAQRMGPGTQCALNIFAEWMDKWMTKNEYKWMGQKRKKKSRIHSLPLVCFSLCVCFSTLGRVSSTLMFSVLFHKNTLV